MCKPKQTFTQLHDLGYTYDEWFIKVQWCLYPHIPIFNKTRYTYVKLANKHGKHLKIFNIAKHESCYCNQTVKKSKNNPYITTLKVIDEGILLIYLQFNTFFILITMYYNISTCLSYIPHDSFSFVVLGEYI